ncbi:ribosomal protein S27AE [Aequitasia blattaphilus]|uniref:Transposase n=2 Tax=Lachnospiraceae TaxID=186803 RepID=A0ABT1EQ36_9FIRM|nr:MULTISPECIES: transposase [Lachnospiraceae]MCP1101023.1 transposase [Aequitasia blattaphilus]MCP1111392.1 transposase [Ohessyouella blattaphilus]MCR8564786.1 transposase [Ohessyouella blattaphilus]MCR8613663.1 transposase [Aequitasia blattaphilus]
MNILQRIFNDYFEIIKYSMHPRPVELENIEKMLNCGDPSFGGAMYHCDCGEWKFVPFRCKSRFCPSCGNMYSIDRTTSMSFKLIKCSHRHLVFTIAEELRHYFLDDRTLLDCLFFAVKSVILRLFRKLNKTEEFTPGFICVLHTFGRDLKWNPHIHCLLSEGGTGNNIPWRKVHYFSYEFLRKSFRTALLKAMLSHIGPSFKSEINKNYLIHKDGFYVYAESNKCNPDIVIKYIGRYLGRPAIATSRIDDYDGDNVTFHYNRHENEKLVHETVPATDFISRLIRHIPEKQYKMIRYYGIYARHREKDKKLFRAIPTEKHFFLLAFNKWRESILSTFGYDPLKCPNCGKTMIFVELYYNHKRFSLQDYYEKVMTTKLVHT